MALESQNNNLKTKDILTLCISIIAFLMSAYAFIENNFLHQHDLKVSVVSIEPAKDSLSCTILIVNSGRSYETVYSGRFIFSDNLNNGGGSLSNESIGPIVIPPNKAIISKLTTKMPSINEFHEDGTIPKKSLKIHTGVLFDIINKKGELSENGKIFKITQLEFDSSGEKVGAEPMKGDNKGMMYIF
ncbi:hypothetical protein H9Q08_19780 [Chryseobacterium sp. PS-8]|uniref:Gliding motility-associated protein GldM C-terminal domain-containing protein n=1 Tax=Chryseobacterium indicum TaxID=2766954 RepID=A0ABS9CBX4_9FLAO|nr:hypothetical protein [Chryseobacterium sp. PS-8]MCF2221510.1 hypothetical protein [Chryseobacterium sp. PS-8]